MTRPPQTQEQALAAEVITRTEALLTRALDRGERVDEAGWHRALIEAAARRRARRLGVSETGVGAGDGLSAACQADLSTWPDALFGDAHVLGWMHQGWSALGRLKSFEAHVQRGERHDSATVSTQLYTPRWVADALARQALEGADLGRARVLDPAAGGGQMLLAALDALVDAGLAPAEAATRLWGWELDPHAARVARWTLKLEVAGRLGGRDPQLEHQIDAQIVCRDALLGDAPGFEVVLTNPPYMGWRSMPAELREHLKAHYAPFERDLYAAFIKRCQDVATHAVGLLVQQGIFYLKRFEAARAELLAAGALTDFLHLGPGAFWGLTGEKASVVAFVQRLDGRCDEATRVWDLRRARDPFAKAQVFARTAPQLFLASRAASVPGRPFCYELPEGLLRWFDEARPLSAIAEVPGSQNKTGANRRFVRPWAEVEAAEIAAAPGLFEPPRSAAGGDETRPGRWRFYSKGGRYAPWWGNWEWVVDWSEPARDFYASNRTSNLLHERYVGREGICYTDFAGGRFNARWMPPGCVFDMTGPAIFVREQWLPGLSFKERNAALLGILNSAPARRLLKALNPTLHFQASDVRALPVPEVNEAKARRIAALVLELVEGVRALHWRVEGDALYDPRALSEGQARALLAKLTELEGALEAEIAGLYQVAVRPLERTSLSHHHALAR
ncbi:N-6 DNA methylase [Lujinxingia vulgaris]|uniref:site-specific DNA-methyltransferase (adenine-specific) n=1 Tax=Lujinxingia vulgaris TaxID=2600176 RepID=A0A5C6X888_9DELT|nr:N-6 DNA methylase [Lujinxingia vulgaris]TXD36512.1 N-6 DNA methylase [Lujinxingia vulgaris]